MNDIISEIYEKLKSVKNKKYVRYSNLNSALNLESDVYCRAVNTLKFPTTKSGASVICGSGLNYSHSIKYGLNALSKVIGVDFVIDDPIVGKYSGPYTKKYLTDGNDLLIKSRKRHRLDSDFVRMLFCEYIVNGKDNIRSIFKAKKSGEHITYIIRSEEEEKLKEYRIACGAENWIEDKVYLNPNDSSDYTFMLNGMTFRFHTHYYNWPTCITEMRAPSKHEAKIIRSGLDSGIFKDVFMFSEEGMAISASCFG